MARSQGDIQGAYRVQDDKSLDCLQYLTLETPVEGYPWLEQHPRFS